MEPFAQTINAAKKYVVSSTLEQVDWNAELVRGDLGKAVEQLKRESGNGLFVGGVKLPLALTELGLIDEYEFVGHCCIEPSGEAGTTDLPVGSSRHFPDGAIRAAQVVTKETPCGGSAPPNRKIYGATFTGSLNATVPAGGRLPRSLASYSDLQTCRRS